MRGRFLQGRLPLDRNMHFGVRELAMTAIGNGMMLHGGLRAYVSTFFVFSDYTKPMARLSALMESAVNLRIHSRQHWCRRGWTDPRADRAAGYVPRNAEFPCIPSVRRNGDGSRMVQRSYLQDALRPHWYSPDRTWLRCREAARMP